MNRRGFLATASAVAVPASAAPALADQGDHGVTPGADLLAAQGWRALAGRRVGVLTNPTGALKDHTQIVDSMVAAGVRPVAAFGPEHGFRGTAGRRVGG